MFRVLPTVLLQTIVAALKKRVQAYYKVVTTFTYFCSRSIKALVTITNISSRPVRESMLVLREIALEENNELSHEEDAIVGEWDILEFYYKDKLVY